MANPFFSIDKLPATSQAAIREFDERYIAAVGASEPTGWETIGEQLGTGKPDVTFPITQLRTQYKRTQGQGQAKDMGETSIRIKVEEFDDGYQAPLKEMMEEQFAYKRWQDAPQALVTAEAQFRHTEIAALLGNGENLPAYDGVDFFDTAHPSNIDDGSLATWSNFETGPLTVVSIANLEAQVTAMQQVRDENGNFMGISPRTIMVGILRAEPLINLLKQTRIDVGGVTVDNPYMNGFNVVVVKEFGTSLDWFLVDETMTGTMSPWVSLRQDVTPALAMRRFDENSDFFKTTGFLRMESHIWYGHGLVIPHGIRKVIGA